MDARWNIARDLPLDAGSVQAIFHEHVLKHLPADLGLRFLKDCHQVLKPGGVMRIVVPNAALYIRCYCDPSHAFLNSWRPGHPSPLLQLQEEFYGFGHRAMYDPEMLTLFCRAAGFQFIEERRFGESRLSPCPDSPWRQTDSLYLEVAK